MDLDDRKKRILGIVLVFTCIAGILYLLYKYNAFGYLAHVVNEETHPAVFVFLFILLPVVGFPIILFLILLGIKFGMETGLLIMFLCLPIHMISSFFLANNFLKPIVKKFAEKRGYSFPGIPDGRLLWMGFVFMVVPGLSYTMKNYILALSGISFRYYFLIGYLVNSILGIPFVIAGHAAMGRSFLLLAIILLFLFISYKFGRIIKKRYYDRQFKEKEKV